MVTYIKTKNALRAFTIAAVIVCSFTWQINEAQIINTVVGNGVAGFLGDGWPATAAELNRPVATTIDRTGNIYIADSQNNCIREINISGIIYTIAGNGTAGFSGDGGMATNAKLNFPNSLAIDTLGNLYILDNGNNRIRKVTTSGIISTIAGNGTAGFSGDGGMATNAKLNYPYGLAIDTLGNLYIADTQNNRIRKINTSGIISTFAGNGTAGFSGNGGLATAAELKSPAGVAVDASGNVYIVDNLNYRIREINTSGIISTIAGDGSSGYSGDGGSATAGKIGSCEGIAVDPFNNIYFADYSNSIIRKINTSGIISTFAGNGTAGFSGDGGLATEAELKDPSSIMFDTYGNLYIADWGNNRIREITGTTGINEFSDMKQISIFPNPANDKINVVYNAGTGTVSYNILNVLGQSVSQGAFGNSSNNQLDVSKLQAGIYFLKLIRNNNVVVGKFVKE